MKTKKYITKENISQPGGWNVAEIELSYKSKVQPADRVNVTTSQIASKLFLKYWDVGKLELQEQFKILLLNRAGQAIGMYELATGSTTGATVDIRLMFVAGMLINACTIMLCHNHPSGNLKPSRADKDLTHKVVEASHFLDLKVLDHLIISKDGYFSFADEGLLF